VSMTGTRGERRELGTEHEDGDRHAREYGA
jgi:hypothetical protein